MRAIGVLFPLLVAASACSPVASDARQPVATASSAVHPESGLPVIDLKIAASEEIYPFRVELARTSAEQAKGLMFRTAMGADEGMLFPMEPPRDASFWMKNTVIPLDIVFIGRDGRILNIAAKTAPYSEEPVPSVGPVKAVLELNGGRAAELGIAPGDRVTW